MRALWKLLNLNLENYFRAVHFFMWPKNISPLLDLWLCPGDLTMDFLLSLLG